MQGHQRAGVGLEWQARPAREVPSVHTSPPSAMMPITSPGWSAPPTRVIPVHACGSRQTWASARTRRAAPHAVPGAAEPSDLRGLDETSSTHPVRAQRRHCVRCSRRGLVTQRDQGRSTSGSRSPNRSASRCVEARGPGRQINQIRRAWAAARWTVRGRQPGDSAGGPADIRSPMSLGPFTLAEWGEPSARW
jgi:hypothetical protein